VTEPRDYLVDLDIFRGPLDLLLFLVKRNEVDIRDIPVARVAEQFQEYLTVLEVIDVERAGEFLVVASTLLEIKSRMTLPRAEEVGEEDDPRRELVRQLLEYKKFKDAAALLESQAERQSYRLSREPPAPPASLDPARQPLRAVEVWDLVSAFGRLMRETLAMAPQQITVDQTPLHVHMERILDTLRATSEGRAPLSALFAPPFNRARLVGLFLGVLELIKTYRITAEQPEPYGDVHLTLLADSEGISGRDRAPSGNDERRPKSE
jgi:segregation and condensation protein A